jgi:hypothetical protein
VLPAAVRSEARQDAEARADLPVGTQVVLLESKGGWALVVRDGRKLGYVDAKALARLQ